MKVSIAGLLGFKPFDEAADRAARGASRAASTLHNFAGLTSAALALGALLLALFPHPLASRTLGAAMMMSAVTAGWEWQAGLRARALNQLFASCVAVLLFWLAGLA